MGFLICVKTKMQQGGVRRVEGMLKLQIDQCITDFAEKLKKEKVEKS